MVFKRLKARFGGGTTLDTVIHTPVAQPGRPLEGVVEIVGGEFEQAVNFLAIRLYTYSEHERTDFDGDEHETTVTELLAEQRLRERFLLHPGERISAPFGVWLPWETPFNILGGMALHKVRLDLATELDIAQSTDKMDRDPFRVEPTPAQQRILAAMDRIGCRFKGSDVEHGRIPGGALHCYQEIEYYPPAHLHGRLEEVELSFLALPDRLEVLLEGDRRGGLFSSGGDRVHRLSIGYDVIDTENWEAIIAQHLEELAQRRGFFG